MKHICFVITNPNHHWDMIKPVLSELRKKPSISFLVVSFCEFRRMKTPVEDFKKLGIAYQVMPGFANSGLKPSSGSWILGKTNNRIRKLAQKITWYLLLKKPFKRAVKKCTEIVLLNDAVFPGNYIAKEARKNNLRLSLLQEGIRFSLPNEINDNDIYGMNVDRIFTWGQMSKEYFSGRIQNPGVEIIAAGCPRIDTKLRNYYKGNIKGLNGKTGNHKKSLVFFSNPIDDQGYTSETEKWNLIADFFEKGRPILEKYRIDSKIKLHPRENPDHLSKVLRRRELSRNIKLIQGEIFSVLKRADYSIVLASTVGLESLLANVPLGVMSIPGFGFAFDYVREGAGIPLDVSCDDFHDRLIGLINKSDIDIQQKNYIDCHFANQGNSAKVIANQLSER